MKTHVLLALIGLATGFVAPAFTQEKDAVDPKIRQQIEAIDTKYDEAFNNHDAASIAALFAQNAVQVTPDEVVSGKEAIEKRYKYLLEGSSYSDHFSKLDEIHMAFGLQPWAVGSWTVNRGQISSKGFRFLVYVSDSAGGGTWKISRAVVIY